jgi:hypothetical protein
VLVPSLSARYERQSDAEDHDERAVHLLFPDDGSDLATAARARKPKALLISDSSCPLGFIPGG